MTGDALLGVRLSPDCGEVGGLVDVLQRVADEQRPAERLDPRDGGRGDAVGAPRDAGEQRGIGAREPEQDIAAIARQGRSRRRGTRARAAAAARRGAVERGAIGADQQDAFAAVDDPAGRRRQPLPEVARPLVRRARTPGGRCPAHDGSAGCGVAQSSGMPSPAARACATVSASICSRQPRRALLRRAPGSAGS